MEIDIFSKTINSVGLVFDIWGAWFVAWEVVRHYKGEKYHKQETWNQIFNGPKETEAYKKYEQKKYCRMKIGLFFLSVGFLLQIASNWGCLIIPIFSF